MTKTEFLLLQLNLREADGRRLLFLLLLRHLLGGQDLVTVEVVRNSLGSAFVPAKLSGYVLITLKTSLLSAF